MRPTGSTPRSNNINATHDLAPVIERPYLSDRLPMRCSINALRDLNRAKCYPRPFRFVAKAAREC
jgi:hypothetical protein